jgi:uncharacterized protein (DUF1501 family)
MSKLNRRSFIKTTGAASVAAAAGGPRIAFAGLDEYSDNILIFVFQRGGSDGLSLVTPMDGHPDRGNYEALRFNGTMIPSVDLQALQGGWGLHPAASPLLDLWTDNSLAIAQAVGLRPFPNRSHFEAERYVELGTPGNRFTTTGWLTRHLQSATNLPDNMLIPAVVTESTVRLSLLREPSALTLRYPTSFDLDTNNYEEEQETALADIYALESGEMDLAGSQALAALELIEQIDFDEYDPSNDASYPVRLDDPLNLTSFGSEMKILAQLIKEGVDMRIGMTDIGGWDTHNEQGNQPNTGWYYDLVRDMSEGLLAFMTDLDVTSPNGKTWAERTTVMVYSEFGRRAFDNNDIGTDHGWGNNCLLMGGGVNGGQFYGAWPGLAEEELFQGADIWATTDYRTIFSEVLMKRLHNNRLYHIFPGFTAEEYQPLGIVRGSLVDPDFNDPQDVHRHGFE